MSKSSGGGGGSSTGRRPVRSAPRNSGFPRDLRSLKTVKSLGGSTGAKLVEDSEGNRFVMKRGNSAGHLREEAATDGIYKAMGVPVPDFRVYETSSGPVKLAKFVKGTPLSDLSGDARSSAVAGLQKNFAADALLGNWDVVGLGFDNVLVVSGTPYRIDNGGSLRYRAQGALKTSLPSSAHFDSIPNELFTLRSSSVNAQTASTFKGLSYGQIMKQAEGLVSKRTAILKATPPELRPVIAGRLDSFRRLTTVYKRQKAAGKSDSDIEALSRKLTDQAKKSGKWN